MAASKARVVEVETTLGELEGRVGELEATGQSLAAEIEAAKARIVELENAELNLMDALKAAKARIPELESATRAAATADAQARIARLETDLENVTSAAAVAAASGSAFGEERGSMEAAIARLEEAAAVGAREKEELLAAVERSQHDRANFEAAMEKKKEQIEELKAESEKLNEVEGLRAELADSLDEKVSCTRTPFTSPSPHAHTVFMCSQAAEIKEKGKEILKLANAVREKSGEVAAVKAERVSLSARVDELGGACTALSARIEELTEEGGEGVEQLAATRAERDMAVASSIALETERDTLATALATAQSEQMERDTIVVENNVTLNAERDSFTAELAEANTALATAQSSNTVLHATAAATLDDYSVAFRDVTLERDNALSTITSLEYTIQLTSEALTDAGDSEELQAKVDSLERTLARKENEHKDELAALTAFAPTGDGDTEELQATVDSQQTTISEQQTAIGELERAAGDSEELQVSTRAPHTPMARTSGPELRRRCEPR